MPLTLPRLRSPLIGFKDEDGMVSAPEEPAKTPTSKNRMSKTAYRDLATFRFELRRFLIFSDAAAAAVGVTNRQYQALLAIKAQPTETLTIKELAHELSLSHHGAVQLVDRLAAQDLARRSTSPIDRRSVLIDLTDRGQNLVRQLAADHLAELVQHEPLLARSLRRLRKLAR